MFIKWKTPTRVSNNFTPRFDAWADVVGAFFCKFIKTGHSWHHQWLICQKHYVRDLSESVSLRGVLCKTTFTGVINMCFPLKSLKKSLNIKAIKKLLVKNIDSFRSFVYFSCGFGIGTAFPWILATKCKFILLEISLSQKDKFWIASFIWGIYSSRHM